MTKVAPGDYRDNGSERERLREYLTQFRDDLLKILKPQPSRTVSRKKR